MSKRCFDECCQPQSDRKINENCCAFEEALVGRSGKPSHQNSNEYSWRNCGLGTVNNIFIKIKIFAALSLPLDLQSNFFTFIVAWILQVISHSWTRKAFAFLVQLNVFIETSLACYLCVCLSTHLTVHSATERRRNYHKNYCSFCFSTRKYGTFRDNDYDTNTDSRLLTCISCCESFSTFYRVPWDTARVIAALNNRIKQAECILVTAVEQFMNCFGLYVEQKLNCQANVKQSKDTTGKIALSC